MKKENFDVIIKDEGEFHQVVFNSEKAISVMKNDHVLGEHIEKNNDFQYINVAKESKNMMITFCVSHNLTVETF